MRRSALTMPRRWSTSRSSQWVIEDRFAAGRPAWDAAGATLVHDVEPYESMKLRLLNASHSAFAYLGFLAGHEFIYQVAAQPDFVAWMRRFMADEVSPALVTPPGIDLAAYREALVRRFANPALPHRTQQIAMDGSQKLPQRMLATIRDNLAANRSVELATLAVAGWMRYVYGEDEQGRPDRGGRPAGAAIRGARGARIAAIRRRFAQGLLGLRAIFDEDLHNEPRFTRPVTRWLTQLFADGAAKTVARAQIATRALSRPCMIPLDLHPDRLFPADPSTRAARTRAVRDGARPADRQPARPHRSAVVSPTTRRSRTPSALFIVPDHYVFRMLYSQGVALEALGVPTRPGAASGTERPYDPRAIWRAVRAALSAVPRHADADVARPRVPHGVRHRRAPDVRERRPLLRPHQRMPCRRRVPSARAVRALQHRSDRHDRIAARSAVASPGRSARAAGRGRVVTAYRPDPVVDPEFEDFAANVAQFGELTGEDTATWRGYLAAHRTRRAFFKSMGATSTDHGHPTARTLDLDGAECQRLLDRALQGTITADEAEAFRAQMLTEMARMSVDDGLVMQIHPGSFRNHNPAIFRAFGRDKGADIPMRTDYVHALKPLLDRVGNERDLTIILFTLDETSYARELAPLAGHYPALKLGPPWWFHDSFRGHAALPRADDRDGGVLQHRRLQRRHARLHVDSGAARRRRADRLPVSRDAASSSTGSARTRRWSSRPHSRTGSRSNPIDCSAVCGRQRRSRRSLSTSIPTPMRFRA